MPRRPRTYYTNTQKALMWERWKMGVTLHQSAKLFDRPHTSIRGFGNGNSQIATLVERQTRYVMLVKVAGKDTQTVVDALARHARKLPQGLY